MKTTSIIIITVIVIAASLPAMFSWHKNKVLRDYFNNNDIIESSISKTEACENGNELAYIDLYIKAARSALLGEQSLLLFRKEDLGCVIKGQIYRARTDRVIKGTDIVFFYSDWGKLKIKGILPVRYEQIGQNYYSRLNAKNRNHALSRNIKIPKTAKTKPDSQFYLISFDWTEKKLTRTSNGAPTYNPLAKIVNKSEVEDLLKDGALPVYIKSSQEKPDGLIANSIEVVFEEEERLLQRKAISPEKIYDQFKYNFIQALPEEKNQKLVVYSANPHIFNSYNATTFLSYLGYEKVYWFRGGLFEWKKLPAGPPVDNPPVPIVDYEEAARLISKGAVPVDVRPTLAFRWSRIKDAVHTPFHQKYLPGKVVKYVQSNMGFYDLIAEEESLRKTESLRRARNKKLPVVVYGTSEYDWRPFKASIWIKEKGIEKVYWFRRGWADWRILNKYDPKKYRIEGTRSPLDPGKDQVDTVQRKVYDY